MTSHPNRSRRIWTDNSGSVFLREQDVFGETVIREFWVAPSGGCVREVDDMRPGTLGREVCDRLASRGSTLTATRETLLDVVRREYRRAAAYDRRTASKFW